MLPRILPREDAETAGVLQRNLERRGVSFLTGTQAISADKTGGGIILSVEGLNGGVTRLRAEKLLIAIVRMPNTAGLGLDATGIKTEHGFMATGDYYETSASGVYAMAMRQVRPFSRIRHQRKARQRPNTSQAAILSPGVIRN